MYTVHMVCLKADVQYDAGPLPVLMCDKNFFKCPDTEQKQFNRKSECMIARLLL